MTKPLESQTIPILYVAGAGRSGSTLLEMILGNLPGCFSIGEARYFAEYWVAADRLCGCGALLSECELWANVYMHLQKAGVAIDKMSAMAQTVDRTRNLPRLTLPFWPNRKLSEEFLTGLAQLYDAIWRESGQQIIVDSSKVPSHLYILAQIPEIDLRVLHLVRDGRAVAYSWNKRRKQELGVIETGRQMPRRSTSRAIITWSVENLYAAFIGRQLPYYTVLRYEDLVQNLTSTLGSALAKLNLAHIPLDILQTDPVQIEPTHSVGGNPLRFTQKTIHVSFDEGWRRQMPSIHQKMLGLLGLPVMLRYGYSIR